MYRSLVLRLLGVQANTLDIERVFSEGDQMGESLAIVVVLSPHAEGFAARIATPSVDESAFV